MTLSIAFIAGLISFLSPCVMPLIPGYISYISGTSLEELAKKKRSLVFLKTIFFTLGFSFVFIVLGSTASYLGKLFLINSNTFRILAGIIIIIFSLLLLKVIDLKFLNKDLRIFTDKYSNNLYFPFLVGAAFGFGWTPCIGPILGSILTLAALEQNINKSILLLSSYSFGLAIPFIISGVLIDKFLTFSKSIKKYITLITKLGGIILLLTGFAILTGQLQVLGFFILENIPYLSNLG
tara:strand:+ start:211 stop:921 length:711 start_codon:yes stop_codon:yes gene_type:complete